MLNQLSEINNRWNLPKVYLEYLEKHEEDEFLEEMRLYGSTNLISNQEGYSYNPVTQKIIEVWPENYVVIADIDADPFVLDLSNSDGKDAPVLFAYHGEGEWSFEKCADSFGEFISEKLYQNNF
jgi:hypothetical protein